MPGLSRYRGFSHFVWAAQKAAAARDKLSLISQQQITQPS